MATEIVQVSTDNVVLALGRYELGIRQNDELMRIIGASQMVSVRRTFREQGSPAGSWAPLSPNTISRNPAKYGFGHKLLVDSGRLLNSVTFAVFTGGVIIGTNLVYAAVHQYGSADRRGAAIGPQARIAGRSVTVGSHRRLRAIHYKRVEIQRPDGSTIMVPRPMKTGKRAITDKRGRETTVTASYQGPLNKDIEVKVHERYQNIPPRPFLVIRPEDPDRHRDLTIAYIGRQRQQAGLQGGE